MAFTESRMVGLQSLAHDFHLPDTISDKWLTFNDIRGEKGTVVMFLCNHCPYVIHINEEIVRIARQYIPENIGFVAISSNDAIKYPDDAPEKMKWVARLLKYPFPYLYDESQSIAKAYDAACTPDFFVYDGLDRLVYRGRIDGSRPGNTLPLDGKDLRLALDLLLRGEGPLQKQYPSGGCNIKWKE